jgi:hypothetical protein
VCKFLRKLYATDGKLVLKCELTGDKLKCLNEELNHIPFQHNILSLITSVRFKSAVDLVRRPYFILTPKSH